MSTFFEHPMALPGLVIVLGELLLAIGAVFVSPYDPLAQQVGPRFGPPSPDHIFGTDEFGRDLFSRVLVGSRISLLVSLFAVFMGTTVGVLTGLISGFVGGTVDTVVMRAWDVLLAFPAILLGIAVAAVLGPGAVNAAIAVGIISMPTFARLTRAMVLSEKERQYVEAARSIGAGTVRTLFRHIFPNTISPIIVQITVAAARAVLVESTLSFLGLGSQPPEPSWGTMLNQSRLFLRQAPWYGVFPGLALALLVLGLNFLADAIRDYLDPTRRGIRGAE